MAIPEKLIYEERQAWLVVRKLLMRRPDVAPLLLEGLSKEMAVRVLLTARDELTQTLNVNRAFSAACAEIAKMEKPNGTESSQAI